MNITRISQISGKTHTLDLPVTQEQINDFNSGTKVQHAFPHLSADQREFILTGITAKEWNDMFPPEDEEEDALANVERGWWPDDLYD